MFNLEVENTVCAQRLLQKLVDTAKGYSLLSIARCAMGIKDDYSDFVIHCAKQRLVIADLMFWE